MADHQDAAVASNARQVVCKLIYDHRITDEDARGVEALLQELISPRPSGNGREEARNGALLD